MSAAIRAGYKQTEVGVIPGDWDVKRLGDIATIATGNTPPTRDAANYGDEFLFVSPADLGDEKHVIDTQKRLSKKGFSLSRCFPKDSILFVCIGSTIGKCGVASIELTTNQQINAIFPASAFSTDYLYYTVCAAAPKVRALAGEQAVPIVNKTQFSQTAVSLPPLPEQHAIAEALGDVDALLAKLDEFIAKKRDLKQAAMQQLLTGQTRLPGFSGEWEVKRLGELFGFSGGHTASRDQLSDSGYCYLHYGDIHLSKKTFIDVDAEFLAIPKLLVGLSDVSTVSLLKDGDVVFVDASEDDEGTSRHIVVVNHDDRPYISGLHTIVAKSKGNRMDNLFKRYCFQTRNIKEQFRFFAVGTKVSGISKASVAKVELHFPPSLKEQTAIATVLSDMDTEIAALEARRDKTRALKQGMMQELLTGRIRLI